MSNKYETCWYEEELLTSVYECELFSHFSRLFYDWWMLPLSFSQQRQAQQTRIAMVPTNVKMMCSYCTNRYYSAGWGQTERICRLICLCSCPTCSVVNTLATQQWGPGLILDVGTWDDFMVTRSVFWCYSDFSHTERQQNMCQQEEHSVSCHYLYYK